MRSKKEIEDRIRKMKLTWTYSYPNHTDEGQKAYDEFKEEMDRVLGDGEFTHGDYEVLFELLEWVLEGKPCYSVVELEKIINWCVENEGFGPPMEDWILEILKDKKRVEKILK